VRKQGNQKHFQANAASPVFTELRALVLKTMGLADVLRTALLPIAPQISLAFVFGSMAKQQDNAASDVDLLVDLAKPMGFRFFGIEEDLTEQVGTKVEMVTNAALRNPYIRRTAERDALVV
jgi:predicted nucleotidyltransferase